MDHPNIGGIEVTDDPEVAGKPTSSQRAMAAARKVAAASPADGGARTTAIVAAARESQVKRYLVADALLVLLKAVPEVAAAVERGQLAVGMAKRCIGLDEAAQRKAARQARRTSGRYRAPSILKTKAEKLAKPDPPQKPAKAKSKDEHGLTTCPIVLAQDAIGLLRRIASGDPKRVIAFNMVARFIDTNKGD
jgi:hypothetical protein